MRIGELARRADVNRKTIRFYGEIGLLAPCGRTEGGYRLYDQAALYQLQAIRAAKEAGLTLEEIRELLPIIAGQEVRCRDVLPVLERKLEAVADQMRRLGQLQEYLKESIATCRRVQRRSSTVACPVLTVHAEGNSEPAKEPRP
ncbi:MAG: MerR family transcriptional regulator [Gemmatimonadetes bacterium]|nr:MerR family transcriptional regulator [Gemmatimonadota bacterium]